MTRYEYLLQKAKDYKELAERTADTYLKTFYTNASKGYEIKTSKLTLEEAAL